MDQDLPKLQKQLDEVNQKISNLVQAIAMGGLGSLDTITQEIQRLEHDKVKLTELVQENQVKKESLTLTLEQLKQVLDESKQYMLSNHDDMVKYILSRFIHKIIIGNETIIVNYNYGGFYFDLQDKVKLTELVQETQIKKESLTLTLEQLKQVLDESKQYMLSNHDDMVKYILSRFIHKIIIGNETIIVNYNYGGFYFDFKSILLLESVTYQRDDVYSNSSLKEVI